ncbi:MAG: carboxylate--amine ligase, partial [Bacteroidales bacterium]|nr:carboxylate--amine ligase [Bacteroidales bacterium]
MKQKKLMLLGGIRYLLPVIKAAHEQGYYVITADYLPDNIAHKYSDEYVNVSIIDKEAVLKVAVEKQIDGIMSFGVDPGVVSASYVQEKMGLPSFGPYESVEILQNKDKFRAFLAENGFNTPWAYSYSSVEDALK